MATAANSQALLPTVRFDACLPSQRPRTKTRRAERGLEAYRNLADALAKRFPVTRRMVGHESFVAMAHRFIVSERAAVVTRLQNWEMFPSFLRSQGNTASIESVADIAELEMAQGKAGDAAAAVPLGAQALQSLLRTERPEVLRLVLHPSAFLVASRFPIVTIWEINKPDDARCGVERWSAECALVTRPFFKVEVRRLPPGGYAFISALSQGRTLAEALDAGNAADPRFDSAINHALLLEANVVTGIRERARRCSIRSRPPGYRISGSPIEHVMPALMAAPPTVAEAGGMINGPASAGGERLHGQRSPQRA